MNFGLRSSGLEGNNHVIYMFLSFFLAFKIWKPPSKMRSFPFESIKCWANFGSQGWYSMVIGAFEVSHEPCMTCLM